MGGSSSKSSAKSETTEYNVSQADYSTGDGSRTDTTVAGTGNTVSVTATDFGAIEGGIDVAKTAIASSSQALNSSLEFADRASDRTVGALSGIQAAQQKAQTEVLGNVLKLTETVKTDGAAQTTRLMTGVIFAIIAGAVVVAVVVTKGKK